MCVSVHVCSYMFAHNHVSLYPCVCIYVFLSLFISAHVSVRQSYGCPAGLCFESHKNMPTAFGSSGAHSPFPLLSPIQHTGCFGVMTLQCTLPFTPHLVCPKVQELTLKQMLGWNLSSMLCIIHHHGATYDQSQWPEYNLLSNLTKIEVGTARSQGLF